MQSSIWAGTIDILFEKNGLRLDIEAQVWISARNWEGVYTLRLPGPISYIVKKCEFLWFKKDFYNSIELGRH